MAAAVQDRKASIPGARFHEPFMIPRPLTASGTPAVRRGYKYPAAPKPDEPLSDEVCAICGYGMTEFEMARGTEPRAHTSITLAELTAWWTTT